MNTTKDYEFRKDASLSEKWKFRFAFFEQNGLPSFWGTTPAWKGAYQKMTFWQKVKVSLNFFAWFFSIIYLLILGLWRKAILVLALNYVVMVIAVMFDLIFPGYLVNAVTPARANIGYCELKVKGIQTWSL